MTKRELAVLYFPQWKLKREQYKAVEKLAYWIRKNQALKDKLKEQGYSPKTQQFTPAQVMLIYEYLGEP